MFSKYVVFPILLLFFFSCAKKKSTPTFEVIGHGACGLKFQGSLHHDNSKEAVNWALDLYGSNGVEIDIQCSLDTTIWLYHDVDLNTETNRSGCIMSMKDVEIEGAKYANQERVARLDQLALMNYPNHFFYLDIRHLNFCTSQIIDVQRMLVALQKVPVVQQHANIYFVLSNPAWISTFQNAGLKVIFSAETNQEAEAIDSNYNLDGFCFKNGQITKEEVLKWKQNSKKVLIFDVRSPLEMESAAKKQPDAMISDDLYGAIIEKYGKK